MTKPEFELEVKKLIEEYTVAGRDPPYGARRIEAIWNAFRDYPVDRFKMILLRSFGSERNAPLASDLLKISKLALEEERAASHRKRIESYSRMLDAANQLPADIAEENSRKIIEMLRGIGRADGNDQSIT